MQITKKDLEKNQVELSIEVNQEEMKPHLEKAAEKMIKHNRAGLVDHRMLQPGAQLVETHADLVGNSLPDRSFYLIEGGQGGLIWQTRALIAAAGGRAVGRQWPAVGTIDDLRQ